MNTKMKAIFVLFLILVYPWSIYAHQDRIYTFKEDRVVVDILTGFDYYIELEKSDILASILSELLKRSQVSSTLKIKVDYIHSYIGNIEPEVYLNFESNLIEIDDYELFKEQEKNTIYVNIFSSQLPIDLVLDRVSKILSIEVSDSLQVQNYNVKDEYSSYEISAIDTFSINSLPVEEDWKSIIRVIENIEFSPGSTPMKRKKNSFFYCNGFYHITDGRIDPQVEYSTKSLYQIESSGSIPFAKFIFEKNNVFVLLTKDLYPEPITISNSYIILGMEDNYGFFSVQTVGNRRYIVSCKSYSDSHAFYYNAGEELISYKFTSELDSILRGR